jgi:hypothetical protein
VRGEFPRRLPEDVCELVAGWASAEAHSTPVQIADAAAPVLEEWWTARELELVARWQDAAGKPDGHGVSGWEQTLAAAPDAKVELLLFQDGLRLERSDGYPSAFECEHCGRASASARECPLPRRHAARARVRHRRRDPRVLRYGGKVHAVHRDSALSGVGGIGALTRFTARRCPAKRRALCREVFEQVADDRFFFDHQAAGGHRSGKLRIPGCRLRPPFQRLSGRSGAKRAHVVAG